MSAPLTPEKTDLKLGFVALLDCAPLVVAREKGFFNDQGLNVILCKEASWASIRDKVSFGLFDAAQMLAPMPLASSLGMNGNQTDMLTALSLSQNGTAITLSRKPYLKISEHITDWSDTEAVGKAFHDWVKKTDKRPVLATVYPYSNHHYQLLYWLKQNQINVDQDVNLVAVPPVQMVGSLADGLIDGFCVGEPWNSLALLRNIGGILTTGFQIWGAHMEKVLGVTREWAEQHPNTHQALVKALHNACRWAEAAENREELLHILALPPYLDQSARQLSGFHSPYPMHQHMFGDNVNRPDPEYGRFLLQQMLACGQLNKLDSKTCKIVDQVYRSDLYEAWL
ncbi:CmpA/NrtA family ABC transporter substrate-binding protein [Pontibacter sp. JAM-7]|uniref:CmpA/NrtA family ABC transporter substrate-binding protein n=1 Tax=Pontibacter sp. JAM-7 TaxID=3366581 RepID=UPI003AF5B2C7